MSERIPNGTLVVVNHGLGPEVGTVIGATSDYSIGAKRLYTIQFADRTISTWGEHRVTRFDSPPCTPHTVAR